MIYNTEKKDGPARIGELLVDDKRVITPNILFIITDRFKAPDFAEITITNKSKNFKKPVLKLPKEINFNKSFFEDEDKFSSHINNKDLFIIKHASQLINQPKKFLEFLIKKREKNFNEIFYIPAVGNPLNLALLTYLGLDFFDSTYAIIAARKKILFFSDGEKKLSDLKEIPCNCPVCNVYKKNPLDMSFKEIISHNYYVLFNELKKVRNAIKNKNLRSLVEKKIINDPNLTTILRTLDYEHYDYLEKNTPVHSSSVIYVTSKESMNRPEIKRFQERIISRFYKPKSCKVLLLLPCSAKKPYSFSKSHKLFKEIINQVENSNIIHELIITSPLGLVPRELELLYPAAYYDIPVTGVWDEDEKKMIKNLLKKYLEKNKYEEIIVHLPKEINNFISDILKKSVVTYVDTPTSKRSLTKLKEKLIIYSKRYEQVKSQERLKDNLESLVSYQFGVDVGKKLLENTIIKGKYPWCKIIEGNKQLGMMTESRGFISLTNYGGKKIHSMNNYCVEIYDDFKLIGSVFAPGVKNADKQIRIGDEVLVLRNKKLVGVGVAKMNGYDMKELEHGEAVKIRHRI
jgi:archaeosine synthase